MHKKKKIQRKRDLNPKTIFFNRWFLGLGMIFFILGSFFINAFLWQTWKPSFSIYSYYSKDFNSKNKENFESPIDELNLRDSDKVFFKSRSTSSLHIKEEKTSSSLSPFKKEEKLKILKYEHQRRKKSLQIAKDFFDERNVPFVSHMARAPSLKDKLRYGKLKGRYKVEFYDGKLEKIQFIGQRSLNHQPIFFPNTKKFMKDYKDFFEDSLSVEKLIPHKIEKMKNNKSIFYETYIIQDLNKKRLEIQFERDSKKRLLSMTVMEFFDYEM